ncbi:MAG: RNA-binding domain-containing protein [Candidatus Thorarchaeota archaeon]
MPTKNISKKSVDGLIDELLGRSDVDVQPTTGDHEAFRARVNAALIIIYRSGAIVFHDSSLIESILEKYPTVKRKRKKTKRELKSINVSLTEEQKHHFIDSLSSLANSIDTPGDHEEAAFELDDAKITIYTKGTVYSPHGHPQFEKAIIETIKECPTHPEYDIVIGQDEVGKGELYGPMIVGSVALSQDQSVILQFKGVRDSKSLNEAQVSDLAKEIRRSSVVYDTVAIGAERFNEMFAEYKEKSKTLNDILAWAHAKALSNVLKRITQLGISDSRVLVIIDEFSRISTEASLADIIGEREISVIQTPRAENESVAVAAAAVLAKANLNRAMERLASEMGVPLTRRNLSTIRKNPKNTNVIKYVFLDEEERKIEPGNTITGTKADQALHELLNSRRLESYDVEFKQQLPKPPKKLAHTIAAMANCDGGEVYLGVKQEKDSTLNIIGLVSPQEIADDLARTMVYCEPFPSLSITLFIRTDEIQTLRIEIANSPNLIYYQGTPFKRVMGSTVPMTKSDIDNWPDSCRSS